MSVVAIIQARMGSTRLSGKILKPLGNKPALLWTVHQARAIIGVDHVVVATSDQPKDDEVEAFCSTHGVSVFRGSENDVLGRMAGAAKHYNASIVMRLTGDCPFLDPHVSGEVLQLFKQHDCDYACNFAPPSWPDGLDTEVIRYSILKDLDDNVTKVDEREHVTLHVLRNRHKYKIKNHHAPFPHLEKRRWTLDTPQDYEFLKALGAKIQEQGKFSNYLQMINILEANPEIAHLEANAKRNESLANSGFEDQKPRTYSVSSDCLKQAEKIIPLGSQTFSKSKVQFPNGHAPLFVTHGHGGRVWDVDGHEYIDLISGLLPNILGYCDPDIDDAIRNQIDRGISFSLATELEYKVAEKLTKHIPCAEKVRFGKNGTDATSAAIRLARAYTKRDHVLVCGYHGWQDWYIGSTTRHLGVPDAVRSLTTSIPFNDLNAFEEHLKSYGDETACFILEAVSADEPKPGYLEAVRGLCDQYGVVLIFDEIITGFRVHLGGAQAHYGVTPDLACFGKGIANGMPLSAIVGRAEIMDMMESIFYSGTFGGETLSLAAALAVIEKMEREPVIEKIWSTGRKIAEQVKGHIAKHKLDHIFQLKGIDPWRILAIKDDPHTSQHAIKTRFIIDMAQQGVLMAGSHNVCYAHSDNDIMIIAQAYAKTMERIAAELQEKNLQDNLETEPIIPIFQVRKTA